MSNSTNTIRLHRVFRAPTERVYRAFLDPQAMAKWLPPHGFTGKVHEMDARVGGGYRMSFTNFTTGSSHSFGGAYTELKPHERIRYTDRFDDPNLPGEMEVTITLRTVASGTEIDIAQEGVPAVIPVDGCTWDGSSRCRFWRTSSRRRFRTRRSPHAGAREVRWWRVQENRRPTVAIAARIASQTLKIDLKPLKAIFQVCPRCPRNP